MYAQTDKPKNDYYDVEKPKRDTSYELADLGNRFIALIIDNIIVGLLSAFIGMLSGRGDVGVVTYFLVQTAYQWYFLLNRDGQTPGKTMQHIRVIKEDGSALTSTDVVLRSVGYQINNILFGLGWIWATFDRNQQGLHDKLAKTYVVKE